MLKRNNFFHAGFSRTKPQKFSPTDRNNTTDKILSVALFLSVGLPFFLLLVDVAQSAPASAVKIISLSGEVKVRRGVEETWHLAAAGMRLEEIDTILTGEASAVILETLDGATFRLNNYAILDIADLRKITEREMFLYLMSNKVNQIPARQEKTRLRIGNVSAVHGEPKAGSSHRAAEKDESQSWIQETNGAKALYEQQYYTNAVVKLHKILAKYPNLEDCGEVHFYLGKTFGALSKPGQAGEAYKVALERPCDDDTSKQRADEARRAIERLK